MKGNFSRLPGAVATLLIILTGTIAGCNKNTEEPEFRAVWLHQTLFDREEITGKEQIISLLDKYSATGINNLFCYYTLPEENGLEWDYLTFLTEEGRRRSIGIHPVLCPGHEINLEKGMKEHPEWMIRKRDGQVYPSYNLANPEVREYWLSMISVAMKYDIAGIHLDYMRYPVGQMFSYDSLTCAEFRKVTGFSPLEVSNDGGSIIWCEWIEWNRSQVTAFVREARRIIDNSGRAIALGVDVFPDPKESEIEIGQSWGTWAEEGLIDFVCPMLYTDSISYFVKYLDRALVTAGNKCSVISGIGLVTSHNKITPELMVAEINASRSVGAHGVAFFSGYSLSDDLLSTLSGSVFRSVSPASGSGRRKE
jgi:uncharacterized lipoprotein YddW (UPF0748 family)